MTRMVFSLSPGWMPFQEVLVLGTSATDQYFVCLKVSQSFVDQTEAPMDHIKEPLCDRIMVTPRNETQGQSSLWRLLKASKHHATSVRL